MSDIYKDIVIDSRINRELFRGIGLNVSKNMLRRLITYKENFPDSYTKINNLLFEKNCGMSFSHLRFETNHEKAVDYAADIMQINPNITAEYSDSRFENLSHIYPQYSALANGNGLSGDGSIIDTVKKIIKSRYSIFYFGAESALNTDGIWYGDFEILPLLWSMVHITHFSETGWRYSDCNTDDDYMSLSSFNGNYTIIFVNDSPQPRKYSVCIKGISKSDNPVHCIETKGPENSGSFCANWFRVVDKILPFEKEYGDCFNIEIKPFSVMTCTTLDISEINGINTFEYSGLNKTSVKLPLILESKNSILPIWDISGDFEEYFENDNTYIEQTEIHENIKDGKTACTIFGDKLLFDYKLTVLVEFADDDKDNFVGIGICCGENGEIGYALKIHPDGMYEIYDTGRITDVDISQSISVISPNCLELIINDKSVIYKLNDEIVCVRELNKTPLSISGYGMLLSAYRRNTFRSVKIEQNEKDGYLCRSHDCLCGDFKYTENWIKNGNAEIGFTHRTSVDADEENQSLEFEFIGKKVALFGKTENLRIKVEIDGAITVAGNAAERDCNLNEAFYIEDGLENTIHILKLTVLSGKLKFDRALTYYSEQKNIPKSAVKKIKKYKKKTTHLKKSTIMLGVGLAAAGAGILFLKKRFGKSKNKID